MDWPGTSVELIPSRDFRPGFCPWPTCIAHGKDGSRRFAFSRHGTYTRRCDGRRVPRFRCLACRKTLSLQTFAFSYYLKRPELTVPIARGLVAASAHRQIARSAGCHHATVTHRARRLGRHAALLHHLLLQALPPADEPIIIDDFDTYAGSQYFPCTLPTAIGSRSWFVYGFAFARERRRGRMSPQQRRRRARLERLYGRPERGALRKAFATVLGGLPHPPRHVIADGDPAIKAAVAALSGVRLEAHPNPRRGPKGGRRTAAARARDRAMFPNDQLHRFLRHTEAAYRRETIAFGRSYNGLRERLALFVAWRNLVQARSERHPRDGTTAMHMGATDTRWSWERVFAKRLQPSRVRPSEAVWQLYRRDLVTPALHNERRHTLTRAF